MATNLPTNNPPIVDIPTSIDPTEFDIVKSHLLAKGIDETAIDSLTVSLLNSATIQNFDITRLINILDTSDSFQLNTVICILLNVTRNRTSILGFTQPQQINQNTERLIIA